MKIVTYDEKRKIYNGITKCSVFSRESETLKKSKRLELYSFLVILDWLNSLLISKCILNENNLYDQVKDGIILLRLINIYQPEIQITGIFTKAIKKKCAIQNLEKALEIIYHNNPYYYSLVSSNDIYEKNKKKVHILFLQLFDLYEFRNLKKIATPLLNWYNSTLKKLHLPITEKCLRDPFNISSNNTNTTYAEIYKYEDIETMFLEGKEEIDILVNDSEKSKIMQSFTTYVLFKDKEESSHTSDLVNEFSDGIKMILILYRYGYIDQTDLTKVQTGDFRNNLFLLQNTLRKLNIPIIFRNTYLNAPSEVSILLQLKYIQFFVHNNGYAKAIKLNKDTFFQDFLKNIKKEPSKKCMTEMHKHNKIK